MTSSLVDLSGIDKYMKDELYLLTKEELLAEILMSEPSMSVSELLAKLEAKATEVKKEIDAKAGLVRTMAMEGPNQFDWVYYKPTCKFGCEDCIHDPAYIKATYPEWYERLYGGLDPETAAKCEGGCSACTEDNCYYDNEDK